MGIYMATVGVNAARLFLFTDEVCIEGVVDINGQQAGSIEWPIAQWEYVFSTLSYRMMNISIFIN